MGEFMGEKRDYITLEVIHHNAYEQQPAEEPEAPAPSISHIRAEARTKKSAATRKRITHETTKLMLARGNTNFKMSEISDRARLSKGALYTTFLIERPFCRQSLTRVLMSLQKILRIPLVIKPCLKRDASCNHRSTCCSYLPDSLCFGFN